MRLPLLPREQLNPEQQPLDQAFREQIAEGFTGFKTEAEDGALLGPWGVWLHEPQLGHAVLQLTQAISTLNRLGGAAKQVAILKADEALAYEVASALRAGGVLPDPINNAALSSLGKGELSELVYLVGLYSMVAVLLNAYDVPGEQRGGE